MTATFNPPPNWPAPPPGWQPDWQWIPDPSWPPPPEGWQLFVNGPLQPWQEKIQKRLAKQSSRAAASKKFIQQKEQEAAAALRGLGVDLTGALKVAQSLVKFDDKLVDGYIVLFPDRVERRLVTRMLRWQRDVEIMPLASINSVQVTHVGAFGSELHLYGSGNSLQMRMATVLANDWREAVLAARERLRAPSATQHGTPNPDPAAVSLADELRKLAELRDAGIITPTDFDAAKAKVLGAG